MRSASGVGVGGTNFSGVPKGVAASAASHMKVPKLPRRAVDRRAADHVVSGQFVSAFRALHSFISTARHRRAANALFRTRDSAAQMLSNTASLVPLPKQWRKADFDCGLIVETSDIWCQMTHFGSRRYIGPPAP